MDRRRFLELGMGAALGAVGRSSGGTGPGRLPGALRSAFPRLRREAFLNAAGGTPLGSFAEAGLQRYLEHQRTGRAHREYVEEVGSTVRGSFARLVGAAESEIALVHCTKAGEQIVLDGFGLLGGDRNVVTNDMHFTGSLHNLLGLRRAGADVRIVRSRDWDVPLQSMEAAIDRRTALVAVTLVSNLTGRIEPVRRLAEIAHARGALVYADVIQAAGIVPLDVRELGIDFAACSGYKWLFGVHGVGFLYVRGELQGTALADRLFPGHVGYNYAPWTTEVDPMAEPLIYREPADARRYQPGHVSYLGYCAVHEGLALLEEIGIEAALAHSVALNRRLLDRIDRDRYELISPHPERSPILAFVTKEPERVERRLAAAGVVAALHGDRLRVSPALYNDAEDVDRLVEALDAGD